MANFGGLGFGLVFELQDKFSNNANKIGRGMGQLDKTTSSAVGSMVGKLGALGAAMGAAFSFQKGLSMAAEMSDRLVAIEMQTGLTQKQIEDFRSELEDLDSRTDVGELMDFTVLGKQLGIANNKLVKFAQTADGIGQVIGSDLGGSAEAATTKIAKMTNLFRDTAGMGKIDAINAMAATLDTLNDTTSANISSVADFANKLGALGEMGPTATQAIGLATALDEQGVKIKGLAAQYGNVVQKMGATKESAAKFAGAMGLTNLEFQKMFDKDPNALIMKLAKSMKGASKTQMVQTMQKLGLGSQESIKFMKLLGDNIDLVTQRQTEAQKAFEGGNSVINHANARNKTLAAQLDKLKRNFDAFLTRLGEGIGEGLDPFFTSLNKTIKAMTAFARSPFGKAVIKYSTALIAIAATGVAVHKGFGMVSSGLGMVSKAFIGGGRAAIGFMAAMGPVGWILLAVTAAVAGLVAIFKTASNSFAAFDGNVKNIKSGFGGMLQTLGGLLAVVKEVWSTWDSATGTFTINNKLMEKLKALGLDKWAINLGTWIGRLKTMFQGVYEGMSEGFKAVKSVVVPIFNSLVATADSFGFSIGKGVGALNTWKEVGKYVGYALIAIFTAMATPIMVFGALVYGLAAIFTSVWNTVVWFWNGYMAAVNFVIGQVYTLYNAFTSTFNSIFDLFNPMKWLDFGSKAIKGLWDGMKGAFGGLSSWLSSAVKKVPVISAVVKWWNGGGEEAPTAGDGAAAMQETGIMETGASNRVGMSGGGAAATNNISMSSTPVQIVVNEEVLGETVINYQQNEMSRQ